MMKRMMKLTNHSKKNQERTTSEGERELRAGKWAGWRPTHLRGTQVTGKTLGCIGFGRIAQATADRAHFGFGMKIIFSDPYMPSDEVIKKYDATPCSSVEEVLEKADFVSIHCPGGESTYHLMNKERKPTSKIYIHTYEQSTYQ